MKPTPENLQLRFKMEPKAQAPAPVQARLSRLISRLVWKTLEVFLIDVPKPYFTSLESTQQQESKMICQQRPEVSNVNPPINR